MTPGIEKFSTGPIPEIDSEEVITAEHMNQIGSAINRMHGEVFPEVVRDLESKWPELAEDREFLSDFVKTFNQGAPWLTPEEFVDNLDRVQKGLDRLRDTFTRVRAVSEKRASVKFPGRGFVEVEQERGRIPFDIFPGYTEVKEAMDRR